MSDWRLVVVPEFRHAPPPDAGTVIVLPCSFRQWVQLMASAAVEMSRHDWDHASPRRSSRSTAAGREHAQKIRALRRAAGPEAAEAIDELYDPRYTKSEG